MKSATPDKALTARAVTARAVTTRPAAALSALSRWGRYDANKAAQDIRELGVDSEKIDPAIA